MLSKRIQSLSPSLTIAISSLARDLQEQGKDVISFSAGEPDFGTPKRIKDEAIATLTFPRQRRKPHRAISDFFARDRDDVLAITCVSAGEKFSQYEKELYDAGKYLEYNMVHGFSVELAEALAEMVHKQIRMDLDILKGDEKATLSDVRMNRYQGARYSFGYPACPDLEQNQVIFDLLKPQDFGIELSETFQIHPEQSTTAIVVHHPKANYFGI